MRLREASVTRAAWVATSVTALLTLVAAGCDEGQPGPAIAVRSSPPEPMPAELETLRATRGGEPIPLRSALAFGKVGSKISLRLSTEPDDCRAVRGGRTLGGSVLELALDPTLRPDGEMVWTAVAPTVDGGDATVEATTVEMLATDVRSEVRGEIDVTLQPSGNSAGSVRLKGTLQARPCGRVGVAPPPARPQKSLHVSVAGRTVEMRAAVLAVEGPDEFSVTVSSAPRGCGMTDAVGDVELRLTAKGDPARVTGAYLYGELIEAEIRTSPASDALDVDIADPGDTATQISMKGSYDHHGLTVKLDGYADAEVCLPP